MKITGRLASDSRHEVKVLLLSFSSKFLPSRMVGSFLAIGAIENNKNVLGWALREKVDYIVCDTTTHKRDELDVPPPPGLLVEKVELVPMFTTFTFLREKTRFNS